MNVPLNVLSILWIATSAGITVVQVFLSKDLAVFGSAVTKYLKLYYYFGKVKDGTVDKKDREDSKSLLNSIPKSWFSHFYILGALVHSLMFAFLISVLKGNPLPHVLSETLRWINLGSEPNGLDDNAFPLLVIFTLELMQMLRRAYECLFVSSFSKGSLSIVHYVYGVFFYVSFGIGVLSSVPINNLSVSFDPGFKEGLYYLIGLIMFLWGFYYQNKTMVTFAVLRQEKKDKDKESLGHYIPKGHLFELVSSPHYFCEIVIYLSFCFISQFSNVHVLSVAFFVATNQILAALSVHKWYVQQFTYYPVLRKAIIPYIL